jgi:hypothetical protein
MQLLAAAMDPFEQNFSMQKGAGAVFSGDLERGSGRPSDCRGPAGMIDNNDLAKK